MTRRNRENHRVVGAEITLVEYRVLCEIALHRRQNISQVVRTALRDFLRNEGGLNEVKPHSKGGAE